MFSIKLFSSDKSSLVAVKCYGANGTPTDLAGDCGGGLMLEDSMFLVITLLWMKGEKFGLVIKYR